ncbi:MAG: hypothetical protein LBI10_01950 [Deltaproteobacteria bacterium]|jgi:hypothetical protein|nr:hypothetical protein [Deltaproteobacteria bacterium]
MKDDLILDYCNPSLIRRKGIEALTKELGPIGMAYFMRQFERGVGDYTKERHTVLDSITMEDIIRELGLSSNYKD